MGCSKKKMLQTFLMNTVDDEPNEMNGWQVSRVFLRFQALCIILVRQDIKKSNSDTNSHKVEISQTLRVPKGDCKVGRLIDWLIDRLNYCL